jgi:hypothetical protein
LKAFVLLVEQFAERFTRGCDGVVEFLLDPPIDLGPVIVRCQRDLLRSLPLAFLTAAVTGELGLLLIVLAPISHQRIFIQKVFIQKRWRWNRLRDAP